MNRDTKAKGNKHQKAVAEMHKTSVFWGLAFGTLMAAVAFWVVGKLFPSPYPTIMMLVMFIGSSIYFYLKWFNRLYKTYMDDVENDQ